MSGESTKSESGTEAFRAEIYVIGSTQAFSGLRRVIGSERVGRMQVRWGQLEQLDPRTLLVSASAENLDVRCWIDLSDPQKASLYFADRSSERFLVREVPLTKALTEVEKETLAQVVETSMMALIEDANFGLSRANVQELLARRTPEHPALPAAPPKAAPEPPQAIWKPILSATYRLGSHSPQIPEVHGPGAVIGIARIGPKSRLSFSLRTGYQLPASYRNELGGLRLAVVHWNAGFGLDVPLDGREYEGTNRSAYFGLLVSVGFDVRSVAPLTGTAATDTTLMRASSIFVPTLGAGCRLTQPVGSLAASVAVLADADLERVSYDVQRNGERVPVLRAHTIRPSLLIELGWP